MNIELSRFIVAGAFLVFSVPNSLVAEAATKADTVDARIQQVLSWLPIETESLFVARGPAELAVIVDDERSRSEKNHEAKEIESSLENICWVLPASPLYEIAHGKYSKHLKGHKAAFVIEASCRFQSVQADGPVLVSKYAGCHVFVFEKDLGETGKSLMNSAMEDAVKVITLADHKVAFFEMRLGPKDSQTFLITQPKPNILLIGADRDYLLELLKRMSDEPETRAFPKDLSVWKQFDPNSRYWAIRRYQPGNEVVDSTTLIFAYTPNDAHRIRLRKDLANQLILVDLPKRREFKEVSPGVVEFNINLKDDVIIFFLLIYFELGHEFTI